MKQTNSNKPQKNRAKGAALADTRQIVENAIDASKGARNRSWEESASIARKNRRAQRQAAACRDID